MSHFISDMETEPSYKRLQVLLWIACLIAIPLLAGLLYSMVGEVGQKNSYALLADSFLNGRLDSTTCYDSDCAIFQGRTFVMFPPVPAIIAMPFVAIFGPGFHGFVAISIVAGMVSLALWWRIFRMLETDSAAAIWLLLALAFATPLYFVTIRGAGVWFFAQAIGFLFVTIAIHEVVRGGSLVLAGACIGLAFLSRQMSIFYLPFLFVLALRPDERLISFSRDHIHRALKLGLPVAVAVAIYLVYNYARFGAPLETGYRYMMVPEQLGLINYRLAQHGLFSREYLFFNVVYFFLQGFHVNFTGDTMLTPTGLDPAGTSLFAASPFVLLAFFVPLRRTVLIGIACALIIAAPTFWYHSNGFSQYNVQRYVLDWLPILFYMLALAVRRRETPAFGVLTVYAMGLNLATMGLLAILQKGSS